MYQHFQVTRIIKFFQIYAGSTDSLIFAMPLQAGDFSVTLDDLLNTNYQYVFKFGGVAPSIHTFTEDIIIYIYRNVILVGILMKLAEAVMVFLFNL